LHRRLRHGTDKHGVANGNAPCAVAALCTEQARAARKTFHSVFFFVYLSIFTLAVLLVMEGETLYEHHRSLVAALTEQELDPIDSHLPKVSTMHARARACVLACVRCRTVFACSCPHSPAQAALLDAHSHTHANPSTVYG
jgi:hypothetical protein